MTPRSAALILPCLLIAGCEKNTPAPAPPPPHQAAEATLPPATTVAPGDSLESIATTCYGHPVFARFLALLNQIPAHQPLAPGQILQTPPLDAAFAIPGFDPAYQEVLGQLAKAWNTYLSTPHDSPERNHALNACADSVGDAARTWQTKASIPGTPNRTRPADAIDQFLGAAALIRSQTTAVRHDPALHPIVCEHFNLGFTYALRWARDPGK